MSLLSLCGRVKVQKTQPKVKEKHIREEARVRVCVFMAKILCLHDGPPGKQKAHMFDEWERYSLRYQTSFFCKVQLQYVCVG